MWSPVNSCSWWWNWGSYLETDLKDGFVSYVLRVYIYIYMLTISHICWLNHQIISIILCTIYIYTHIHIHAHRPCYPSLHWWHSCKTMFQGLCLYGSIPHFAWKKTTRHQRGRQLTSAMARSGSQRLTKWGGEMGCLPMTLDGFEGKSHLEIWMIICSGSPIKWKPTNGEFEVMRRCFGIFGAPLNDSHKVEGQFFASWSTHFAAAPGVLGTILIQDQPSWFLVGNWMFCNVFVGIQNCAK